MSGYPAYREPLRPQIHFTARENWLNDPNGCVRHGGVWHLFFQHNPQGLEWGNMTWGHATSTDLLRWRQTENAIRPYGEGTIFSGSAVVDHHNTSGLGTAGRAPLVTIFTHAANPSGQAIAYSTDEGGTWVLFDAGRHVVPNQGFDTCERDPKVFWHEATGRWVMALWVALGHVRFFASPDLLRWTALSDFRAEGFYECPDLVALPVMGEPGVSRWVLYDAALRYWIGLFDGDRFIAESGPHPGEYGANFYAAQTWNGGEPRVVQIGWMRGGSYPGMPFNQQMSFPCELGLRRTAGGLRLTRTPVAELETLVARRTERAAFDVAPETPFILSTSAPVVPLDLRLTLEPCAPGCGFHLDVAGQRVSYHDGDLTCLGRSAPVEPAGRGLDLRLIVDRASLELFAQGGLVSMSSCFEGGQTVPEVRLTATGGELRVRGLTVSELSSIWD